MANLAASKVRRHMIELRALARLPAQRGEPVAELLESEEHVWAALRTLPRRQAQVLALHYLEDASIDDIAAALEIKPARAAAEVSHD